MKIYKLAKLCRNNISLLGNHPLGIQSSFRSYYVLNVSASSTKVVWVNTGVLLLQDWFET